VVFLSVGARLLSAALARPKRMWPEVNTAQICAAPWLSFFAAVFDLPFRVARAWVRARHHFPGLHLIDAAVDLTFALRDTVGGIALTELQALKATFEACTKALGFKIACTPSGIFTALIFVGLPCAVRTVQPVIDEIGRQAGEASAPLGAIHPHAIRPVILPMLAPAALTGFAQSLTRAKGELGSAIQITGNLRMKTEIAPRPIVIKLEEVNYDGAIGIATLAISVALLVALNEIHVSSRRRIGYL
jgi:sulfate/thiosulfate transport system permease protein